MNNVSPLLPTLTVHRQFISDFLSADTPCLALGVVEERKRRCGFLALRPDDVIPPETSNAGFRFGHALLGTSAFEVALFTFEFYGFQAYNAIVNPNNPLVRAVLRMMAASGDYFFFAVNPNASVTAFRSEIGQENLAGLRTNLPRMLRSTTTETQYQKAVAAFQKNPDPPGVLLDWVCQDNVEYLDLTTNRLDMTPD